MTTTLIRCGHNQRAGHYSRRLPQACRKVFDALRHARKAAPTPEELAALVKARTAAEQASTVFERDEIRERRKQLDTAIAAARRTMDMPACKRRKK